MPKVVNTPPALRAYVFHGLDLQVRGGEALGDCPWCLGEGKFSVNVESGLWRCLRCAEGSARGGGNALTFLRALWKAGQASDEDYAVLARDRGLLDPATLRTWGVCRSPLTGEWLVPGHDTQGNLDQLYRYSALREGGRTRMRLLATPGVWPEGAAQRLFGVPLADSSRPTVYVCEGPWDAMALWEVLRGVKRGENLRLLPTSSVDSSLGARADVLATPGCGTFPPDWAGPLFAGREVVFCYDNDHPKTNPRTGDALDPAGWSGVRRAARVLGGSSDPPKALRWLAWGGPEASHDPALADGYDVRDVLAGAGRSLTERAGGLSLLLDLVAPVPADWVPARGEGGGGGKSGEAIACLPCRSWRELTMAWRKALRWIDGLDHALAAMLASITSVKIVGDQLWLKVIGPAGCGKSTLCEAISVNKQYVYPKSTIRGFHSGFKTDREGAEDHSLITQIKDKTLVTKDGDTLLQSPNLPQILSEARDLYDCTSRTHYRHGMSRDYDNVRMTWLLCGTSSLRSIDSSELGERFLDCVIMEEIDPDLEDEVLLRVAHKAERNMAYEANGSAATNHEPALLKAMQLTGGYVTYLRTNAQVLCESIVMGDEAKLACIRLGKFVAYMRARPSTKQTESAEREFAARLVSQHVRLAKCLAAVLNREEVDTEVLGRVRRVALDTARGRTLKIAQRLYAEGEQGIDGPTLALLENEATEKLNDYLRFLSKIGVIEAFRPPGAQFVRGRLRWKLTARVSQLYGEVMA